MVLLDERLFQLDYKGSLPNHHELYKFNNTNSSSVKATDNISNY